jgi:GcrA cell cycle regulator
MIWDDETILLLKDLWAKGHSTAEIGRRLHVSKNAIVGKAHRLDLDARPSPVHDLTPIDASKIEKMRELILAGFSDSTVASHTGIGASRARGFRESLGFPKFDPTATKPVDRVSLPPLPSSFVERLIAPQRVNPPKPRPPVRAVLFTTSAVAPRRPLFAPLPQPAEPLRIDRDRECCWPIGEPRTKAFRFCGDAPIRVKPYCPEHAGVAYVRVRQREEAA